MSTSGAVKPSVPCSVSGRSPNSRATPRSLTIGLPSPVNSTLPGERSAWTTPRACRCATARLTGDSEVTTSPGSRCPRADTTDA